MQLKLLQRAGKLTGAHEGTQVVHGFDSVHHDQQAPLRRIDQAAARAHFSPAPVGF